MKIASGNKVSDFVLNQNKDVLRKSLNQINNALYVEFENVAKWAMNRIGGGFNRGITNTIPHPTFKFSDWM